MNPRAKELNVDSTNGTRAGRRGDERGMALVLALMVLLVLTVIGAALMANVTTETKISGHQIRDTQSLSIAEAGVQEAMLRIRNGDFSDDLNPRNVHLIYNEVTGTPLPTSGTDTTSIRTLQPAGGFMQYSTANKNPTVLLVKYKTRGSEILKYDDAANPKINTATGNPIYIINATGRNGTSYRSIYAEVTRSRFNIVAHGAICAAVAIKFQGNIKICGHDHLATTPDQEAPNNCHLSYGSPNPHLTHPTCMPGAWTTSTTSQQGSPTVLGNPTPTSEVQSGFYTGPWDALGMQQTEFWSWVGNRVATEPSPPRGIFYLDNDNVKQNATGNFTYNGGDGEGFLYVDGDLRINGSFTYRGMIYVEGDLTINGNSWILGGIVVKGKATVRIANGSAIVLYSSETIQQKISKYGGNIRTIAWREL